jgi:ABC-2 type transport system permease protein
MNAVATSLHAGCARGLIELRQSFAGAALLRHLLWPAVTLAAIFFLRNRSFQASGFTLGTLVMPSVLGMFTAFGALLVIQYLVAEREDGTLLRAIAIPNGVGGYFVGKLVTVSGTILAYLAILLVVGLLIVHGLEVDSLGAWLTLAWVLLLGLVATQSIGAVLGSLISTPRGAAYMSLPVLAG